MNFLIPKNLGNLSLFRKIVIWSSRLTSRLSCNINANFYSKNLFHCSRKFTLTKSFEEGIKFLRKCCVLQFDNGFSKKKQIIFENININ